MKKTDVLSPEFMERVAQLQKELANWLIPKIEDAMAENDEAFALVWEQVLFTAFARCLESLPKDEILQVTHVYTTALMAAAIKLSNRASLPDFLDPKSFEDILDLIKGTPKKSNTDLN